MNFRDESIRFLLLVAIETSSCPELASCDESPSLRTTNCIRVKFGSDARILSDSLSIRVYVHDIGKNLQETAMKKTTRFDQVSLTVLSRLASAWGSSFAVKA